MYGNTPFSVGTGVNVIDHLDLKHQKDHDFPPEGGRIFSLGLNCKRLSRLDVPSVACLALCLFSSFRRSLYREPGRPLKHGRKYASHHFHDYYIRTLFFLVPA